MKTIVIFSFNTDGLHLATELQLARNHMDNGDLVHVVVCGNVAANCSTNVTGSTGNCAQCISKRILLFQSVGANVMTLQTFNANLNGVSPVENFQYSDRAKHDGFEFGRMVSSSYASVTRRLEFNNDDLSTLNQLYISTINVYRSAMNAIRKLSADTVYVFNSRFVPIYGVVCAAKANGVNVIGHERGARENMYALYKDANIHSIDLFTTNCKEMYDRVGYESASAVATEFYSSRRNNRPLDGFCFTNGQIKNSLPSNFITTHNNIAVFLSSDDEFYFMGQEWIDPLYGTQFEALKYLVSNYSGKAKFWIRAHPNMITMDPTITERYRKLVLSNPNWTFIEPDDECSTYSLMDACSKVISFGSTAGIEAAYAEKPSVLLGMSFYRNLGSVYIPQTKSDVFGMIDGDLPALPKLGSIKYAHYVATFGIEIPDYVPEGLHSGTYCGIQMSRYITSNTAAQVITLFNRNFVRNKSFNRRIDSFFKILKLLDVRTR